MRIINIVVLCGILLFVGGCEKKNEPTSSSSTPETAPTLQIVTFQGPSKTNTDPTYHAFSAASYAMFFNGLLSSEQALSSLPGQRSGNTWTWTLPTDSGTSTYRAQKNSDGSYSWQLLFTGTKYGRTYNNFVLWSGQISADGKSGVWEFYEMDCQCKVMKYEFSVNPQGVKTGTLQDYGQGGVVEGKIVLINNPDGSGSCDVYERKAGTTTLYLSEHIE
ncbi:MAG: hypothetical protein N3A63_09205 [Bacteroidetes bacterium]|nr:hypothetical protein [Bacteroidota bacterium]